MSAIEDNDDEPPLNPPAMDRVLRRAFCLSAVVCRSFIDEPENEHCASLQTAMKEWLDKMGAQQDLELWEADCINAPTGSLEPQIQTNASWLSEGLAVLAWALNLDDLPPHDECIDPKSVADSLNFLHPDAAELFREAELLGKEEIESESDKAFAIHWRLRQFQLDGRPINFREYAQTAWFGPLNIEGVAMADDDLSIKGRPIAQASADLVASAMSIAQERHRAFNWLLGYGEIYSEVDTST